MAPRARRLLLAIGLPVLLLGGGAAWFLRPLWQDRADYSAVVSIEQGPLWKDRTLLDEAAKLPVAARYLAGGDLAYQKNQSFCGPASLVNVLRSGGLDIDQDRILEGTDVRTVFGLLPGGMTLDEVAALARARGAADVKVLRDLDLASFRDHMLRSNDLKRRYIVNFHRGPLFGRGHGHHSPILGYLADRDLVVVGDVNRKFGPWLVRSERLFQAVDTVDPASGRKRGLMLME